MSMQRTMRPAQRISEHLHQHHELLIIRAGRYHGSIDGSPIQAGTGAVVAIGPGQQHADACDDAISLDAIQFAVLPGSHAGISMPLVKRGCALVTRPSSLIMDELIAGVDALIATSTCPVDIRAHLQDAHTEAIIWRWLGLQAADDRHEDVSSVLTQSEFSARLLDLFDRHVRHGLTVGQMGQGLDMPVRTLDWQCRRIFQSSPAHLFRRHRLLAARAYMLSTRATVGHVAEYYGFPSASHFSRVYRKEFSCTPGEDLRTIHA